MFRHRRSTRMINDNLLNLFADVLDDITKKHDEKYKTKEDEEVDDES